jgi:hypothetical protein
MKEFPAASGSDYIVEGSAGQGQWVRCPWVAVFDPIVTDSAERGVISTGTIFGTPSLHGW